MGELFKAYGRGLTSLFVVLVITWIALMIAVPQFRLVERAFTYENQAGADAMIGVQIDRAYTEKFKTEQELKALQLGRNGQSGPATPTAPSPFAPTPSAPSVNTPSPTTATPGAPGPGFAPSIASPPASELQNTKRVAQLTTKLEELSTRIKSLEAEEVAAKADAANGPHLSLKNFTTMSPLHLRIFVMTLFYALTVTVLSFVICYPIAYAAASASSPKMLSLILLGLVIPYAINELLRIFSWIMILEKDGLLNTLLSAFGLVDLAAGEGMRFVASNWAVFTVMVYAYVLFMVFPIYNAIETLDKSQIEAARDLGAASWRIHARVIIPHAKPGIAVGAIMTFMLSAGSIAVPEIVGRGMHPDWFSQLIYRRFFEADSWNQGSAYSLALLAACVVFILANMAIFKVGVKDIAK